MNASEMKSSLGAIAKADAERYAEELYHLGKEAKTERSAIATQKQVAETCATFVELRADAAVRERRVFCMGFHYFDGYKDDYNKMSDGGKELFLAFAFAVTMVNMVFISNHEKNDNTDTDSSFKDRIILGTAASILKKWQNHWNEHGNLVCEVIK